MITKIKSLANFAFIGIAIAVLVFGEAGVAKAASKSAWRFGIEAFALSDDNISKSQVASDVVEDNSYTSIADASYTWGLGFSSAITLVGNIKVEEFQDFDGLSNTQFGILADYRFQTRNGFTAPAYSVFLRLSELDFETDNRDGSIVDLGFSVTRRLTEKLTGSLGFTMSRRSADGEVFDLDQNRFFANIDFRLSNRWATYATYSFIDGDVFSTATPTVSIINWADAIEPDNAFGGIANNKFVYRLDADTQNFKLGANLGISRKMAFDFSVESLTSDAAGPNEYDRFAFTVSYLQRF